MKKYYFIITLTLSSLFGYTQNYDFGIIHITNYDFKIVAIPDFDSTGNTDISDVGFTLVLPAGNVDVINPVGLLSARPWTAQEFDATFLTGLGLGDGTKDIFQFNMPPGQSLLSHTSGQTIDLVSFSISNSPTSDQMYFLLNNDPLALGAGNVLDSFYNSNIDETTTQDYFSAPAAGLDSFMFSTLSISELDNDSNSISIFPNPVNDVLNIKLNISYSTKDIKLYTIEGKLINKYNTFNSNDNNIQLDIRDLSHGMYFITITSTKNEISTFKFVVN